VQQCLHFISGFVPFDPEEYRFCMHYRIRHKNGSYRYIHDEKIAIKTENGTYLYLILLNAAPNEEKFCKSGYIQSEAGAERNNTKATRHCKVGY